MSKDATYLKLYSYAAIGLLDESILKLNPLLKFYGFEFIGLTLKDLEQRFASLVFGIVSNQVINPFEDSKVSSDFFSGFFSSPLFDHEILNYENKIYFLKSIDCSYAVKEKGGISGTIGGNEARNEIEIFSKMLITKLRIMKDGQIRRIATFQHYEKGGNYMQGFDLGEKVIGSRYIIQDTDITNFQELLNTDIEKNTLCQLSIKKLNLSYEIQNLETKYITLMTALESLFNRGRDQITHIVSRHLAIITSDNKKQFLENYKKYKKLYAIRSAIIHGDKIKNEDLEKNLLDLGNLVRKAISYCLKKDINKDQLFDHLNSKGYA